MASNDFKKTIKPIKSASLADQVERSLMEYLKANQFTIGDNLPKEIELAEELGVSRNIVREALSRLKMLGMVESKKRKGLTITEPDILSSMTRLMDPALLSDKTMQDVFELRLVLEVGMSDLLFLRKTPKDLRILKDIAEREAKDPKCAHSQQVRSKYEIEFHGKLYSMTGNSTLSRFQEMLLPVFNYMRVEESKLDEKPPKSGIDHFDLIETLDNGNAEQFRNQMREHVSPHYLRL